MKKLEYPTVNDLIEWNAFVLTLIKAKRADQAKVLSRQKVEDAIDDCIEHEGDTYDKAVVLLQKIIQYHAFASGNRRTAFVATKYFLEKNKTKMKITDDPANASVMQGIRENYYSHDEIKEWLQNGKIREFKRK